MIRDKDKIYGEANDPDTVVVYDPESSYTLHPGRLLVGAGNKGIKVFNPGPYKLIYTDGSSYPQSLDYHVPNKLVGTNASGQLVLKDLPELSDSIIFPTITRIFFDDDVGTSYNVSNGSGSQGHYSATVMAASSSTPQKAFYIEFDDAIEVKNTTLLKIILSIRGTTLTLDNKTEYVEMSGGATLKENYSGTVSQNLTGLVSYAPNVISGVSDVTIDASQTRYFKYIKVPYFRVTNADKGALIDILIGYAIGAR